MVKIDQSVIARLKKDGEVFEILVDCEKALDYRIGKIKDLESVLASKEIFKDVKKADRVPVLDLKKAFKTDDLNVIADIIIKKGEIQITAEHKNKLREDKRKQIVAFIHRNAVDPVNGAPHPPQRIEKAMEEAKVKINEFESLDFLVQHVITAIRPILRIKLETREVEVLVNAKDSSSVMNFLKRNGTKILKDQWLDNGSLKAVIEIPAGIYEEIENELNKITKGDVDIKILNKK